MSFGKSLSIAEDQIHLASSQLGVFISKIEDFFQDLSLFT